MSIASYSNTSTHETPAISVGPASIASVGERPLEALYALPQWVLFRFEIRDGHRTKVPYNARTGSKAAVNNPSTWSTHAVTKAALASSDRYDGIMHAVSGDSPHVVADIDDVVDPVTGAIEPWAMDMVVEFNTYTEVSVSGTGLHIIGTGKKIDDRCKMWKHDRGSDIEIYEKSRFLTVSERVLPGYETIRSIQEPLDAFITEHWIQHQPEVKHTGTAAANVSLDVKEIVDLARNNPKFVTLYDRGDTSDYGGDDSSADMALCCLVAWYTKDPAQILNVWQSSALKRAKTDRKDYTSRTIAAALKQVTGQYDPNYGQRTDISLVLGNASIATDDMPVDVEALQAELARERAMRQQWEDVVTDMRTILASPHLDPSPKLTTLSVYLEGTYQINNPRRTPTELGYHIPAGWLAKHVGLKPANINTNLKKLGLLEAEDGKPLIDRKLRREEVDVSETETDMDTGEITNVKGKRRGQRSYISLPDNMVDFATRIASYRKPEGAEKRGGKRVVCDDHPDAGTVTTHITKCAHKGCDTVLHESKTHTLSPTDEQVIVSVEGKKRTIRSRTEFDGDIDTTHVYIGATNFVPDVEADSLHSPDTGTIGTYCTYKTNGEECSEITEECDTGYGSATLCHRHAREYGSRRGGNVTTVSATYAGEVAS